MPRKGRPKKANGRRRTAETSLLGFVERDWKPIVRGWRGEETGGGGWWWGVVVELWFWLGVLENEWAPFNVWFRSA
jgi:hypothetical protein